MTYRLEILPSARRELARLEPQIRKRIDKRILLLAEDPRPHGVRAPSGEPGVLRLRVGDYRVVYLVRDETLVVTVVKVGHRREVYR